MYFKGKLKENITIILNMPEKLFRKGVDIDRH